MLSFPQISLCISLHLLCISFALVSYLNIRHSLALLACFCPHFFAGDAESDRMRSDRPCRLPSPNALSTRLLEGKLKRKMCNFAAQSTETNKKRKSNFPLDGSADVGSALKQWLGCPVQQFQCKVRGPQRTLCMINAL